MVGPRMVPTPQAILRKSRACPWSFAEHDSPRMVLTALQSRGPAGVRKRNQNPEISLNPLPPPPPPHKKKKTLSSASPEKGNGQTGNGNSTTQQKPHPKIPLKNPPMNRAAQAILYEPERPNITTETALKRLPSTTTPCRANSGAARLTMSAGRWAHGWKCHRAAMEAGWRNYGVGSTATG